MIKYQRVVGKQKEKKDQIREQHGKSARATHHRNSSENQPGNCNQIKTNSMKITTENQPLRDSQVLGLIDSNINNKWPRYNNQIRVKRNKKLNEVDDASNPNDKENNIQAHKDLPDELANI